MTYRRLSTLFALLCALAVTPAWGVSKEMIQLQTQVQQLQEQMTAMQRSFDERMGVMKNLVERDTDSVNKVAAALTALQNQSSTYAANVSVIQARTEFTKEMINTLKTGTNDLTLADPNEEGASLLALQTRQSLSSTALSLATQADQNVLRLFR